MPTYIFKTTPEFWWLIGVAVASVLLQAFMEFDPEKIKDFKVWAVGIGSASVRAAAGAAFAWLTKPEQPRDAEGRFA